MVLAPGEIDTKCISRQINRHLQRVQDLLTGFNSCLRHPEFSEVEEGHDGADLGGAEVRQVEAGQLVVGAGVWNRRNWSRPTRRSLLYDKMYEASLPI